MVHLRLSNIGSATNDSICTLNGTRTEGNIKVASGATLIARSVGIEGDIQIETVAPGTVTALSNRINDNLQCKENRSLKPLLGNGRMGDVA